MSQPGFNIAKALTTYGMALGLSVILVGCGNQPTTFSPNATDRFVNHNAEDYKQASKIVAADYLFVIDPSFSQWGNQSSIRSSLQNFMANLESDSQKIDYRIGFLEGNYQAPTSSTPIPNTLGSSLIGGNFLVPGFSTNNDVINSVSDEIGQPLAPNRSALLESAARFVTNSGKSFVRSGAQLVYVFISDEDDVSHTVTGGHSGAISSASYYVTQLKKIKSNQAYVSARALLDGNGGLCTAGKGQRLYDTAYYLNAGSAPGSTNSYCIKENVDLNLNSLVQDVSKTTTRFQLLQKPAGNVVKVYVTPASGPNAGVRSQVLPAGKWSYNSSTNEIIFVSGQQPASDARLEIEYKILFALSQTPKQDTITVTVNGNQTSAWSYVASENRIEFSSDPGTDAEVLINYEVQ